MVNRLLRIALCMGILITYCGNLRSQIQSFFNAAFFFSKIFKFYPIFNFLLATNHIFSSITDNFLEKNFQFYIFLGKELTILISLISEKKMSKYSSIFIMDRNNVLIRY